MTDYSKTTKANLVIMYENMHAAHREALAEVNKLIDSTPPTPAVVPEAEALAACIRAFDELGKRRSTGYSLSFGSSSSTPEERILLSLAAKYGVSLVRPTYEAPVEDF